LRSRPPQAVFAEARQLVADGARELVLIGQDTTSYGADRGAPCLPRLIEGIAARAGDAWLRLMYAHPAHFTDDVIAVWSRVPTLCPYVDLPLQHLADPILRRMGRSVTQRQVLGLIERLRSCVPDVAIRTTLIVGFPGETDALFQEMLRRVEAVGFDHLGAFAYSREPGTRAARLRSQVPEGAKRDRLRELMALQKRVVRRRNRSWIGREADILIDALKGDHDAVGRMRSQAPEVDGMTFLKAAATPGRVVRGRIVAQDGYDLVATPVSAASAGHRPG
jgi:ribosomal protein S12 methylthiotransferase